MYNFPDFLFQNIGHAKWERVSYHSHTITAKYNYVICLELYWIFKAQQI
jgi:hypothetical protein